MPSKKKTLEAKKRTTYTLSYQDDVERIPSNHQTGDLKAPRRKYVEIIIPHQSNLVTFAWIKKTGHEKTWGKKSPVVSFGSKLHNSRLTPRAFMERLLPYGRNSLKSSDFFLEILCEVRHVWKGKGIEIHDIYTCIWQITIIPKPELMGFGGDSPTKPIYPIFGNTQLYTQPFGGVGLFAPFWGHPSSSPPPGFSAAAVESVLQRLGQRRRTQLHRFSVVWCRWAKPRFGGVLGCPRKLVNG